MAAQVNFYIFKTQEVKCLSCHHKVQFLLQHIRVRKNCLHILSQKLLLNSPWVLNIVCVFACVLLLFENFVRVYSVFGSSLSLILSAPILPNFKWPCCFNLRVYLVLPVCDWGNSICWGMGSFSYAFCFCIPDIII